MYQLNFSICVSMNLDLLIFGKFKLWSQYLRIFGIHLLSKNYYPVSLLFVVNKFFEKLVNNKVVDHLEKFGFFLISSMTSGRVIQLQLWQEFWKGLAQWHSWKFGSLQSRSKCDQASDFEKQLGAWSSLLISLQKKFNLFNLTIQLVDVKLNKSNFDEKSCYDVRVVFLL